MRGPCPAAERVTCVSDDDVLEQIPALHVSRIFPAEDEMLNRKRAETGRFAAASEPTRVYKIDDMSRFCSQSIGHARIRHSARLLPLSVLIFKLR